MTGLGFWVGDAGIGILEKEGEGRRGGSLVRRCGDALQVDAQGLVG